MPSSAFDRQGTSEATPPQGEPRKPYVGRDMGDDPSASAGPGLEQAADIGVRGGGRRGGGKRQTFSGEEETVQGRGGAGRGSGRGGGDGGRGGGRGGVLGRATRDATLATRQFQLCVLNPPPHPSDVAPRF